MALRGCGLLALAASLGGADALLRSSRSHIDMADGDGMNDGIYVGQEDACMCMNWKEAYKSQLVSCGRALEFYLVTRKGIPGSKAAGMIGEEFCGKFFQRIDDNFCVNVEFGHSTTEWFAGQWCYVSAECESPRAANHLVSGTGVRWKLCNASDQLLRAKSPEELDEIRGSKDLDLGLLAKFSYPVWQDGKWPELERFLLGEKAAELRASEGRKDLDSVVASGKPMLFDSESGHPPFHVVAGSKVYRINFKADGKKNYAKGRMGDVNEMNCIQGCQ